MSGAPVSRVASRFAAAATTLGGATEVVTAAVLEGGAPSASDLVAWAGRHALLGSDASTDTNGLLILVPTGAPARIRQGAGVDRPAAIEEHEQHAGAGTLGSALRREIAEPLADGLWRVRVMPIGDGRWVLTWRRSHLISDAWTTDLLLSDLIGRCRAGVGPDTPLECLAPLPTVALPAPSDVVAPLPVDPVPVPWTPQARAAVDAWRESAGVSTTIAVAAALARAGTGLPGSNLWLAFSGRRGRSDEQPGCSIGVTSMPISSLRPASRRTLGRALHRADQVLRSHALEHQPQPAESWATSVRNVLADVEAGLGPCVTSSGGQPLVAAQPMVADVATCVDRRHGNYSVVAHVDRFRGRLSTWLVAAPSVVAHHNLVQLAEALPAAMCSLAPHPALERA